jgi:hypothetical protein
MKFTIITSTVVLASALAVAPVQAGWASGVGQADITTASRQELSAEEEERLQFMREEEKMARDVYRTLFNLWEEPVFDNISRSEQRHMNSMKRQLDIYGIEDPVIDDTVGVFDNEVLGNLYQELVSQGEESLEMALRVGAYIEEIDILDLEEAIAGSGHDDVVRAYENLLRASRNHLRAFVRKLESMGIVYEAVEMDPAQLDEIVDSPMERGARGSHRGGKGKQGRGNRCRGRGRGCRS